MTDTTLESLCEFYNSNKDFRDYVDRFADKNCISVIKALQHKIVKEVYISYQKGGINESK